MILNRSFSKRVVNKRKQKCFVLRGTTFIEIYVIPNLNSINDFESNFSTVSRSIQTNFILLEIIISQ